jgi:pSer/pThr/pTyr-binding forkhead associated (FHA) protein
MITRSNQLLNYIQELKLLIDDELCQEQFFLRITQDLDEITNNLETEKLSVNLLSVDLELAKTFYCSLNALQNLSERYQFCLHELQKNTPQLCEPIQSEYLILEEAVEGEKQIRQTRYQLLSNDVLIVGRKPGCNIHVSDYCTHVSGQHLALHFCLATDRESTPHWQIQNCIDCRNGTYINGEQLTSNRVLRDGDRLILGSSTFSVKSPALVFKQQLHTEPKASERLENQIFRKLVSHDILFVIIESDRKLLAQEQKIQELASTAPLTEVFLATPLDQLFYVNCVIPHTSTPIGLEILNRQLAAIDEKQLHFKKNQRALMHILLSIDRVIKFLLDRQEGIKQEIRQIECPQNQGGEREIVEDTSALLKEIFERKSSFSKSVEAALNQDRQDLIDDSLSDSIFHEVLQLINGLEPTLVVQGNRKYLELRSRGRRINVNDFIIDFCEGFLLDWATEEWRKICKEHGGGGLNGLIQSSSKILEPVCERTGKNFNMLVISEIEIEEVFQAPLRRIPYKVEYREDPAWLYFVKMIRTSVFQIMSILFLLTLLGQGKTRVIRRILEEISKSSLLSILALGILFWLLFQLYSGYRENRSLQINKVSEQVKQDLKNYYQKVIKNRFAEKLSQILEERFKEEIDRFDESIKSLLKATGKRSTELVSAQVNSKKHLRDCQSQLTKLERKLRDIEKIKIKFHRNFQDLVVETVLPVEEV